MCLAAVLDTSTGQSLSKQALTEIGPVHTYPDIFEAATFSFWIWLPSTRIRWIRYTNPQLFESAHQSRNFWIRYEYGIVWTPNPDIFLSSDVTRSCVFKMVLSAMLSLLYFLDFNFESKYITCRLCDLAMITVHLNYSKRRLDILKLLAMSGGQVGRRKHAKRAN